MVRMAILFAFMLAASPASAGEPSDLVKRFYDRQLDLFDAETASAHTGGSLQAFLDELAIFSRENPDYPCVDFDPLINAQDYDEEELARTLKLEEEAGDEAAVVTASFGIFGETRSVIWNLNKSDGSWKVTDIASGDGDWRFSDMICEVE